LLLYFVSAYTITKVQEKEKELKLNGTYQLLVYAAADNIMGNNTNTIKKEALLW
jgi:hypothetical protein